MKRVKPVLSFLGDHGPPPVLARPARHQDAGPEGRAAQENAMAGGPAAGLAPRGRVGGLPGFLGIRRPILSPGRWRAPARSYLLSLRGH